MAAKYILIDYEKYKALLNRNSGDYFQNKADNFMENKTLDDSSKNIFYNLALKQLLKSRKEKKEEPLNVKFDPALLENLIKQEPAPILDNSNATSHFTDTTQSFHSIPSHSIPDISFYNESPPRPARKSKKKTQKKTVEIFDKLERRDKANVTKKKTLKSQAVDKVADYLYSNRDKYDINEAGEILDIQNRPIKNSGYKLSAQRLVHATSPGVISPKGHTRIKIKARKDLDM
uniref:Uncharacterized protein n=1 Tax=Panagrolaimus davidi TaxID=227884 RepID=A0A914PRT2_9BILA